MGIQEINVGAYKSALRASLAFSLVGGLVLLKVAVEVLGVVAPFSVGELAPLKNA